MNNITLNIYVCTIYKLLLMQTRSVLKYLGLHNHIYYYTRFSDWYAKHTKCNTHYIWHHWCAKNYVFYTHLINPQRACARGL